MPAERTEIRSAVLDGHLYAIGGFDSNQIDQWSAFRFDPATNQWEQMPSLPEDRHHVGTAVHDGTLYVIGGLSGDTTDWTAHDSVWAFDGQQWTKRAPMPTARGAGVAAAIDGSIYVAGGSDVTENTKLSLVERYDPAADSWEEVASMPYSTQSMGGGVIDGKLHICGGRSVGIAGGTTYAEHVQYDPATDTWETLAPLPTKRAGFGTAVSDGNLWVIGGEIGLNVLSSVEIYDPTSNSWATGPSLPNPDGRHGHTAGTIDGTLYVAGGTFPPGATANNSVIALRNPSTQ